ncbi:MAG TPA: hypothetical protein VHP37_14895 [Burkholderiales bacterium]|nr:hypothetical protein [Burkholderiales bacterium]
MLETVNVYNGETQEIADVAFLAYASPRAPRVELVAPLRAAGLDTRRVGDCAFARGVMAATAEGHAAGNAI